MNVALKRLEVALAAEQSRRELGADPVPVAEARRIGEILVDLGRIDQSAVAQVLTAQAQNGRSFGWTAGKLGLLGPDDIQAAIAVRNGVLRAEPSALSLPRDLVLVRRPQSPEAEQFRSMRTRLITTQPAEKLQVVSVIPAGPETNAVYVAVNLAAAFAQMQRRVLLVDAELRRPRIAPYFRLAPSGGLSGLLSGKARFEEAISETPVIGLSLLPSGPRPSGPQELLAGEAFRQAIARARAEFDIVMMLTAGAGPVADGQLVWAQAGSAIVVARRDETRAEQLRSLSVVLRQLGVEILGSALTD